MYIHLIPNIPLHYPYFIIKKENNYSIIFFFSIYVNQKLYANFIINKYISEIKIRIRTIKIKLNNSIFYANLYYQKIRYVIIVFLVVNYVNILKQDRH